MVYSTCSIHAEEDERVVAAALKAGKGAWRLAPRSSVLPTWERRGLPEELGKVADRVIRCLPEDKTNGFFVSCFERVQDGDEEEQEEEGQEVEDDEAVGGKRAREDADDDDEEDDADAGEVAEVAEPKPKTAAQIQRARRKKKLQKKRKIAT